ncbi:hypothetical protein E3T55_15210 [Cryobacterium frigoriphilum]|uniref:Uncharacterized protein n=1 Tax=Cryobacterium frigoriphilum TaxID=1259150 RepID=A0A4R8ZVQ1_9MICO|nr:hypothetical protein [Cryobacterium frigoriphilum]TFD47326.1 hypothetical protein E3T55_15210 [Cryobacterium frigoriphilum]
MTSAEMLPAAATPAGETPAGETPAGETPAAATPAAARPSVRFNYSRTSVVSVLIAILLMLTGALLLTFTELGILAWTLTIVGLAVELFAISRPRVERS